MMLELELMKRRRQLMEATATPLAAHAAAGESNERKEELLPFSVVSSAPTVAPTALVKRSEIPAEDKLRVLAWHHANGGNQRRTAAHFQATEARFRRLSQATVSRWLLAEQRFRALVRGNHASVIREKTVRHPEVERSVALWLARLPLAERARLTGKDVKSMARRVYDHLQTPAAERLELSNGWLSRFQARHGLKLHKPQGDAFATARDLVATERRRLQRAIGAFLSPGEGRSDRASRSLADVWHVDETSFFFDCSPVSTASTIVKDGDEGQAAVAKTYRRLTLTLAANATGTERLEPLFVGREARPSSFDGPSAQERDFQLYSSSSTAWMTPNVFSAWLQTWNQQLAAVGRQVLLLLDPSWCHMTDLTGISNIHLVFLSPLTSELVKPSCLDLSSAFHALYRRSVVQRALENLVSRESSVEATWNEADLFEISQLDAMNLAKAAWQEVGPDTLARSWRQAQILPVEAERSEAERTKLTDVQELQGALDALASEAARRDQPLTLIAAGEFVQLGLDDALGSNLGAAALVALVRDAERNDGDSKSKSRKRKGSAMDDGTTSVGDAHESAREAPSPRASSPSGTKPTGLSPPSVRTSPSAEPAPAVTAEEGLSSLVTMENHWRATGTKLPADMLELLQRTRAKMQREFASIPSGFMSRGTGEHASSLD